jgi:hypothetical protein
MTRSRYGLLVTVASAAFAWWYRSRSSSPRPGTIHRGETIYRNTPLPSDAEGLSGGPT